jgi:phage terminase small subunit
MRNKIIKRKKNLTLKQRKFIKSYLSTGNGTESALKSYNTDKKTASQIAYENLRKPDIAKCILSAYKKIGIDDSFIAKQEKEGLLSNDLNIRHKYLDMSHKVKGDYKPENNLVVNVGGVLTKEDREQLLS